MTKINLEIQVLNNKIEKLFDRLSKYSDDELNRIIIKNKWSINHNIYHLILAEMGIEKYIRIKTQYPETLVNVKIISRIIAFFLELSLKIGFTYKGPASVTENFPKTIKLTELKESWKKSRNSLNELINSLDENILSKGIFNHGLIGRMDIYMTLNFFKFHFNHHKKIIYKLEQRLNY
tara:strand:+ start:5747 stop:6280 length:534 start_codon:yes stop_codon:yes gene_type:complete